MARLQVNRDASGAVFRAASFWTRYLQHAKPFTYGPSDNDANLPQVDIFQLQAHSVIDQGMERRFRINTVHLTTF